MKESDKYRRLVEAMKRSTPELTGKEKVEEEIMTRIRGMERQPQHPDPTGRNLFSWVEVGWIRRSMSAAAALIIGLFIFQQVSVNRRISRLEDQVVTAESDMNGRESPVEKILFNLIIREQLPDDSITVSRSDMEALLRSYRELEKETRMLKRDIRIEPFLEELNMRRESDQEKDRSDLKL